jgi:catechol 2,3-dioxygenase-like lactoylglutathione lyase family enzyme
MPQAIAIQHLNHIARPTRRLEESRRFYIEVLGFREISRPAFSFRGSWLFGGGIQIHLIEDLVIAPNPPDGINTRETHIAFAVPDVDVMETRLEEHGIPYKRSLIKDRQIHQLFFRDPDGHLIELGKYGIIDQ